MIQKGLILTISAPSGTGKDSICAKLIQADKQISFFATATTRKPRDGEKDGIDYHFLTKQTFEEYKKAGKFVEWVEYHGNYYGTLRNVIEEKLTTGFDVITDLTWHGVATMKKEWPQNTIKFLFMPPSAQELERRLNNRQQQSNECSISMQNRVDNGVEDAHNWQNKGYSFTSPDLAGSHPKDYDYIIINEHLNDTVKQVHDIIKKERAKRG